MTEIDLDNMEEVQQQVQEPWEGQDSQERPENTEGPESPDMPEAAESPEAQDPVSDKEKLMRSLVSDDDETDELTLEGMRQMLDAAPRWFLHQWKLLLLCLAGIFLYITNGYQAQMELMEESRLETELNDWRYRCITRVSELTLLCRQSRLEQMLHEQGDSTLLPSKVSPYIINVKD